MLSLGRLSCLVNIVHGNVPFLNVNGMATRSISRFYQVSVAYYACNCALTWALWMRARAKDPQRGIAASLVTMCSC